MDEEVRIDPAVLDRAAGAAQDLRDRLRADLTDVEPESTDVARGLGPGWDMRRSVEDLNWWWRDELTRLGRRLDGMAAALSRCALDYRAGDRASADRFLGVR